MFALATKINAWPNKTASAHIGLMVIYEKDERVNEKTFYYFILLPFRNCKFVYTYITVLNELYTCIIKKIISSNTLNYTS